jgi:hypothetical protein
MENGVPTVTLPKTVPELAPTKSLLHETGRFDSGSSTRITKCKDSIFLGTPLANPLPINIEYYKWVLLNFVPLTRTSVTID